MELISKIVELLLEIDQVFSDVVHGNRNIEEKLKNMIDEMATYTEELYLDGSIEREFALEVVEEFGNKVSLIQRLLEIDIFKPSSVSVDDLRNKMDDLELKRYEIMNRYVTGVLTKEEIDLFEIELKAFKKRIYEVIPENDDILLEIAKMKSKIQHLNTEILEDEEVLRVAYNNSN